MDATDLNACARLVHRGDPDRFRAAMCAPTDRRGALLALYAFNLEVARASWVTAEPMLAQMRLQWWLDVLEEVETGRKPRAHEVVRPLASAIMAADVPVPLLVDLVQARHADIERADHLPATAYLDATAGALTWAAALTLGVSERSRVMVQRVGRAHGAAAYLRAVPALVSAGRLAPPDTGAIRTFAAGGLEALDKVRARRQEIPPQAGPALIAAWRSRALLNRAYKSPEKLLDNGLEEPEVVRRASFIWVRMTRGW